MTKDSDGSILSNRPGLPPGAVPGSGAAGSFIICGGQFREGVRVGGADLIIAEDAEDLACTGARRIARVAREAVNSQGHCSLALAGGGTPRSIYEKLRLLPDPEGLPWGEIDFYFGDERCVPPDDNESNYRMARETLLSHPRCTEEQVHRMEAERRDRQAAAAAYARLLPDPLDLLLLGMGPDGHTASLFPGSPALEEHRKCVVVVQGPKPPPWRLTITPPVIGSARAVLVLVSGKSKAAALARALDGPLDAAGVPAQLARHGIWIVDRAAASELKERP